MLSFNLPSSHLALLLLGINSVVLCAIFILMSVSYTAKRAGQSYAEDKEKAPSVASFKTLSKVLFVSSMLITLLCFWFDSPYFYQLHKNIFLQLLGMLVVLIGYLNLRQAFHKLGNNYSPLFDAYQPFKLITQGLYKHIRHPIYLFNLFVSFGLAIASGSIIVLVNAIIGLLFVLKAIQLEEAYLSQTFTDYQQYQIKTWKLIPTIW